MSRPRSITLFVAVVLGMAVVPTAVTASAAPADRAHAARAEHERIVAFWTPERMRSAIPRDFERLADGSFRLAKPAKGKPGGGTGTTCSPSEMSTGASWCTTDLSGGDVQRLTGKVLFTMGGANYVCSAAVADDGGADRTTSGRAVVLTAAHCVFDQATREFATNWTFIPDFDASPTYSCANTKYGCWTAQALVVHEQFASEGTFNETAIAHDFAFAVVGPGGKTGSSELDGLLKGEYLVQAGAPSEVSALGYPQARPYTGKDLVYCRGSVFPDSNTGGATWGLPCTMTGGASGGPWLDGLDRTTGAGGRLVSLNSYKYTGLKDYMYGPTFNAATLSVHARAKFLAGSSGAIANDAVV